MIRCLQNFEAWILRNSVEAVEFIRCIMYVAKDEDVEVINVGN